MRDRNGKRSGYRVAFLCMGMGFALLFSLGIRSRQEGSSKPAAVVAIAPATASEVPIATFEPESDHPGQYIRQGHSELELQCD
jgi:hypothetical protein